MTKEQLVGVYLLGIMAYENDELMVRADEAFSKESGSLKGFAIFDILLFIVFYPFYFILHQIDKIDSNLADVFVQIFNYFLWFVFSPVYLVLIVWNRLEG